MSVHNYIVSAMRCPRCGEFADAEIECKVGDINLDRLGFGDIYPSPLFKTGAFLGYSSCSECNGDFWAKITLEEEVIVGISRYLARLPICADECVEFDTCDSCNGPRILQLFEGFSIARVTCDCGRWNEFVVLPRIFSLGSHISPDLGVIYEHPPSYFDWLWSKT